MQQEETAYVIWLKCWESGCIIELSYICVSLRQFDQFSCLKKETEYFNIFKSIDSPIKINTMDENKQMCANV